MNLIISHNQINHMTTCRAANAQSLARGSGDEARHRTIHEIPNVPHLDPFAFFGDTSADVVHAEIAVTVEHCDELTVD